MNRYGCVDCGLMVTDDEEFCFCAGDVIPLPTAAELLAFRLRMSGRGGEAARVERDAARLQEHRGRGK